MATRQYIGARYVPKFYENSDGTSEWRSGVIYEPLTIVTYNSNSYTSKKMVPATIGNPSTNPAYWVATGEFNEQLANLQTLTEDLSNSMETVRQNIKGSYILIGDSYSVGLTTDDGTNYRLVGGWADHCKTAMESAGYDVYINTRSMPGNTGFASSLPFLRLLQAIKEDHVGDHAEEVTHIVVIGGTNDLGHETGIEAGIAAFCEYAHSNFPNAKISIGTIGSWIGRLHSAIVPNYKLVTKYGGEYIGSLTNLFCVPNYICADGLHLTEAGYNFYWPTVLDAIVGGRGDYKITVESDLEVDTACFTGGTGYKLYTTYTPEGFAMSIDSARVNVPVSLTVPITDLNQPTVFNIVSNVPVFPLDYVKFAYSTIIAVYTSDKKANASAPFWLYCNGNKIQMYNTSPQFPETNANYSYFHVNRETLFIPT